MLPGSGKWRARGGWIETLRFRDTATTCARLHEGRSRTVRRRPLAGSSISQPGGLVRRNQRNAIDCLGQHGVTRSSVNPAIVRLDAAYRADCRRRAASRPRTAAEHPQSADPRILVRMEDDARRACSVLVSRCQFRRQRDRALHPPGPADGRDFGDHGGPLPSSFPTGHPIAVLRMERVVARILRHERSATILSPELIILLLVPV